MPAIVLDFITPFPTTWFGKHANGCTHIILGISCSMYSIISAVKNQPSPVWFPIESTLFKNKKEIRKVVFGRCPLKHLKKTS